MSSRAYCTGCGRPQSGCPGGCGRDLDPARYCPECGRRLVVQVFPGHVVSRCPQEAAHLPSASSPA